VTSSNNLKQANNAKKLHGSLIVWEQPVNLQRLSYVQVFYKHVCLVACMDKNLIALYYNLLKYGLTLIPLRSYIRRKFDQ